MVPTSFNGVNFKKIILILLGYLAIYSFSFSTPYLFDDYHTIQHNQFVKSIQYLDDAWRTGKTYSSNPDNYGFRPVTTNFNTLGWILGNGSPIAFQILKKLLFFILCFMASLFFVRLSSLIFKLDYSKHFLFLFSFLLIHPVFTQGNNYIAASSSLICTLFYFTALYFYLISWERGNKFLALSCLLFFLSVMSKEEGATFPAIILVLEILRCVYNKTSIKKQAFSYALIFATFILSIAALKINFEPTSNLARGNTDRWLYFATQWQGYLIYLKNFFWPFDFNFDNANLQIVTKLLLPKNFLFFFLNLSNLIYSLYLLKKKNIVGFGILGFYITILPASSVIPLAETLNDHRAYMAYFFFSFSFLSFIIFLQNNFKNKNVKIVVYCLLGFLASSTMYRNYQWRSAESIWADTVKKNPNSPRAKNNYGKIMMEEKKFFEAEMHLKDCLKAGEQYFVCHINLGVIYAHFGKELESKSHFLRAIDLDSGKISSRIFYAQFLIDRGFYTEAKKWLLEANEFAGGLNQPVQELLKKVESK